MRSNNSEQTALLHAIGIRKAFSGTVALANAGFTLMPGEVHGLIGSNGAGKSTLAKVFTGQLRPDQGDLQLKGKTVKLKNPKDALGKGVAIVTQKLSLAPDMSVAENIFLPEFSRGIFVSTRSLRERTARLLERLGYAQDITPDLTVRDLSTAKRQIVEIAKALALDSSIIILDEPTASLTPHEIDKLFVVIDSLVGDGKGIIFVSHRLEEVFSITHHITVLREGTNVCDRVPTKTLSQSDLIRLMTGQESGVAALESSRQWDERHHHLVLKVANLRALPLVKDVSFQLHEGEIVALAGLVGAGRTEVVRAIFGLDKLTSGVIHWQQKPFHPSSPKASIRSGMAFVPENRQEQGITPELSSFENAMLAHLGTSRGIGTGYQSRRKDLYSLLKTLDLKSRVLDQDITELSGGTQQKVVLIRWLLMNPSLLIIDEPTQGVDISTRTQIYTLIRRLAEKGVSVLLVSSDFEEVLGLSDRVLVMSEGTIVADLKSTLLDEEKLTMFATPRTSSEGTHQVLEDLVNEFGGTAYWIYIDGERVFCFDRVGVANNAEPGFSRGEIKRLPEAAIPKALKHTDLQTGWREDGNLVSTLISVKSKHNHDLGMIGLTLPRNQASSATLKAVGDRVGRFYTQPERSDL